MTNRNEQKDPREIEALRMDVYEDQVVTQENTTRFLLNQKIISNVDPEKLLYYLSLIDFDAELFQTIAQDTDVSRTLSLIVRDSFPDASELSARFKEQSNAIRDFAIPYEKYKPLLEIHPELFTYEDIMHLRGISLLYKAYTKKDPIEAVTRNIATELAQRCMISEIKIPKQILDLADQDELTRTAAIKDVGDSGLLDQKETEILEELGIEMGDWVTTVEAVKRRVQTTSAKPVNILRFCYDKQISSFTLGGTGRD
ncbi:MAG TPA: hypothetical protein VF974_06535 [Patescibacteria group bacterium]